MLTPEALTPLLELPMRFVPDAHSPEGDVLWRWLMETAQRALTSFIARGGVPGTEGAHLLLIGLSTGSEWGWDHGQAALQAAHTQAAQRRQEEGIDTAAS